MEKLDAIEVDEWTESLDSVLRFNGPAATGQLLRHLSEHAQSSRVPLPSAITTPFRNTISPENERPMPGDLFMERRIRSLSFTFEVQPLNLKLQIMTKYFSHKLL